MKQKKIFYIALLVLLPFVWACSNEEEHFRPDPPVEEGYSVLRMSFDFPKLKSSTYAEVTFGAIESEREIRSIAFITKTDDEGTAGQPDFKQGELNVFLSGEEVRSANGLYEPLAKSGNGYMASVKVRSYGFGTNTEVAVIANYEENGLAQMLKDLANWEDLSSVITPEVTDNLLTPLLMVDQQVVTLASGATVSCTFNLERVVARIDVINEAADPDPGKGLVLESAQLVYPRKYSYIMPGNSGDVNDLRHKIAVTGEFSEVFASSQPVTAPPQIAYIYTYETSNDVNQYGIAATAVRIKGLYKGIKLDKVIPIKQPDKDGVTGDPIPLKRNYRYAINLKPGADPSEVTWTVKVADWDDGEEILVKPPVPDFEIINIRSSADGSGAVWNAATRTYDLNDNQGVTVRFTTRGCYATAHSVTLLYDLAGTSVGLDTPDKLAAAVLQQPPVVTYATVEQDYVVTLPAQPANLRVPVGLKVVLSSLGNESYKDSVTVKLVPGYDNTSFKPVLLGGKYWAPINVGATTDQGTARDVANMGYVYQFGRKEYPSDPYVKGISMDDVMPGPVSYDDATTGLYKDMFITSSDWLAADDPNRNYRNLRWNPDVNDSPCPDGWRVPTNPEYLSLINNYNNYPIIDEANRVGIQGDELNTYLFIGKSSCRRTTDGGIENGSPTAFGRALYWTSTFLGGAANYFELQPANAYSSAAVLCWGFPVRCIQQDVKDGRS